MTIFQTIGSFLGDHLLLTLIWLMIANFGAYLLLGEDENRVAHKKARYPLALLLVFALCGGALGALLGYISYHPAGAQKGRGVIYSLLMLLWLSFLVLCILYSKESPVTYIKGAASDFRSAFGAVGKYLGKFRTVVAIWIGVLSLISFILFGVDKRIAVKNGKKKKGKSRIPEKILIIFSALGGATGSFAAMLLFRHKTRHPKFFITVPALMFVQLLILLAVCL